MFPHLFAEYERLGADCILLSMCSADPRHSLMARAHAATNCYWIGLSSPAIANGRSSQSRCTTPAHGAPVPSPAG